MKRFILWLIATILTITIVGLYFEYCVNRPIEYGLEIIATIAIIVGLLFYLKYTILLLTKQLKIKNK